MSQSMVAAFVVVMAAGFVGCAASARPPRDAVVAAASAASPRAPAAYEPRYRPADPVR